jgi:hypothetical protein
MRHLAKSLPHNCAICRSLCWHKNVENFVVVEFLNLWHDELFQLHLTRQIGYHIVQTYIPSSVFVVSKIYIRQKETLCFLTSS